MVRVWDIPVRLFHVLLASSVAVAWLTADDAASLELHLAAGWLAAGLVAFRLVWGLVSGGHARLREMAWPPRDVVAHAVGLVRGGAPRHLGHNPVAGWAALGALGIVGALTVTGVVVLGGEEGRGPLAGAVSVGRGVGWHEVHEAIAWAMLAWVAVHVAGVLKESVRTRENLVAGMVTGRKRGDGRDAPARGGVGLGVLVVAGAFVVAFVRAPAEPARTMPDDPTWRAECGDCHLAFHPSLLPARSWARMMREQGDHFGEDLMLDPKTVETIQRFVLANSADAGLTEAAWRVAHTVPGDEAPQRITALPWWKDVHADVATDGEALDCAACHADAEAGAFENRGIQQEGR